jgi:hypothetical protein
MSSEYDLSNKIGYDCLGVVYTCSVLNMRVGTFL